MYTVGYEIFTDSLELSVDLPPWIQADFNDTGHTSLCQANQCIGIKDERPILLQGI